MLKQIIRCDIEVGNVRPKRDDDWIAADNEVYEIIDHENGTN